MTAVERNDVRANAQLPRMVMMGSIGILLIAGVGWWCGLFGSGEALEVDFRDAVSADANSAAVDSRPALRIAVAAMISPKSTRGYYQDLLRLVGEKVGRKVIFSQRKTYAEVNGLLEHKEVDLAFVCSGPYVSGHDKFDMEILVVPVAHGEKVYYCYFLANRDSVVESVDDFRGKAFAFTDPHSNTGCLVPKYVLARRGYTPETFFSEVFFSHSHDNSIKAVAEGLADGAAVDQLIWDFMDATDPTFTSRTKIVEKSPPYGIPPVVVHPDLDRDLKRRLQETFLSLHEDAKGNALLDQLQIDRFEQGNDAMYDSVRQMQSWLAEDAEEHE